MGQKCQELLAVHEKNFLNWQRLMRVGDKYLENMETFVLNHLSIVSKQIHTYLQMLAAVDIGSHNAVIGAVQQDLTKKLDRLTLRDITIRLNQGIIVFIEEKIEIRRKVSRNEILVSSQKLLEGYISK